MSTEVRTVRRDSDAPIRGDGRGADGIDILLVLGHVIIVRNFVVEGVLEQLIASGLRVAVVAPDDTLASIRQLTPRLTHLYPLSRYRPTRGRIRTLQRLRLGSFYARRAGSAYAMKLAFGRKVSLDRRATIAFWKQVERYINPETLAGRWAARLKPRASARELIASLEPRAVVWPTTISDPSDFEIAQAAASARVPLVVCEGSWDNLVTKGAIWPRPDHLLVWGEFSRQRALAEHGLRDTQVEITGPPHFGIYTHPEQLTSRREWCERHGLDPSRRIVLVAGSTIGSRVEPELLRRMSRWIAEGRVPKAYVWYRPHPKVGKRFDASAFAGDAIVRVDPSIDVGDSDAGMSRIIHTGETAQRADGLAACDIIVSMFSTVVLEGALLGKPALLVDLRDMPGVSVRPTTGFQGAAHVQFMMQGPWLKPVPNLDALEPMLNEFLSMDLDRVRDPLRAFAQQVASCGPESPHERTVRAINRFVGRHVPEPAHV